MESGFTTRNARRARFNPRKVLHHPRNHLGRSLAPGGFQSNHDLPNGRISEVCLELLVNLDRNGVGNLGV